jgi:nucleotide-binding universal stress UspA family protein
MRDSGPILVPLDGSELAESAIPYAAALAKAVNAQLTLLTVWDGSEKELAETFPSLVVDIDARAHEHFNSYLEGVRDRKAPGAATLVREGDPADTIMATATEINARCIAIGTHGRSGIGRWLAGSTATNILRHSSLPMLAVGPALLGHPNPRAAIKHIMTPLDGSAVSEAALPVTKNIASGAGARVSLVRAVPWAVQSYPYTLPDAYVPQVDDELEKAAKAYLKRMEAETSGIDVRAFVVRGPVSEGLMEFVDKEAVDLVAMTTHARSGLKRIVLGSVAERIIQGNAPVLLIRPEE